jgi:hypothetical protein
MPVCLDFDDPEISSDGGRLLLRQMNDQLGPTAGFAACSPDARDPRRVLHDRHEQTRSASTRSRPATKTAATATPCGTTRC